MIVEIVQGSWTAADHAQATNFDWDATSIDKLYAEDRRLWDESSKYVVNLLFYSD